MYLKIIPQYRFGLSNLQWSKINSILNRKPLKMHKDNCIITKIFMFLNLYWFLFDFFYNHEELIIILLLLILFYFL